MLEGQGVSDEILWRTSVWVCIWADRGGCEPGAFLLTLEPGTNGAVVCAGHVAGLLLSRADLYGQHVWIVTAMLEATPELCDRLDWLDG